MATDFIMPRMPDPQQQSAFFPHQQMVFPPHQAVQLPAAYQQPPPASQSQQNFQQQQQEQQQQQQHYNPQISPLSTSGNASPTSPKAYMTRQTRPMYMPAVLRPNEFPSKAPLRAKTIDSGADERVLHSNSSYLSLSGLGALGRLSRRSTADSGKCVDGNWNLDLFPKPTGAPTRKHWKPDQEAAVCDDATCKRYFSYFTRRHHCRKCGNIFCDSHSSFEVPLDQEANYNPRGAMSRACQHCFSEFKEWRSRTNSQSSSLDWSDITNSPAPTSPIVATSPTCTTSKAPLIPETPHGMSVPRDWNWSTF